MTKSIGKFCPHFVIRLTLEELAIIFMDRGIQMQYRKLGSTGLRVSRLGIGGSHFGSTLNPVSHKEIINTLSMAFERGINFYDTADIYGQGESEIIIGKAFKGKRDKVILATKGGFLLSRKGSVAAKVKPLIKPFIRLAKPFKETISKTVLAARSNELSQSFSSVYLRQAVEGSLRRLKTDYIDLYQLHEPPSSVILNEEVVSTLELLKSEGKIRCYGIGCEYPEDAILAAQNPGFSSVQVELNLFCQSSIATIFPNLKDTRIGFIARQPYASGLIFKALSKSYDNLDIPSKYLKSINRFKAGFEFDDVQSSDALAKIALQFVLQFQEVDLVISGIRKPEHLEQYLNFFESSEISSETLVNFIDKF